MTQEIFKEILVFMIVSSIGCLIVVLALWLIMMLFAYLEEKFRTPTWNEICDKALLDAKEEVGKFIEKEKQKRIDRHV